MRERQRAAGEKPRYDGTWRPEPGKQLPAKPEGRQPVVRFRNPLEGDVTWEDAVKGRITISNRELDDLVIARPDGTPTYNFCVVVDDWDMKITHVIRGDDHVNNTPRQIHIFNALGKALPGAPHETLLVLDGTTGLNMVNQAREFNAAVPLTDIVVTKLDGTARGGIVVTLREELGIPVKLVGVGEKPGDLREFHPDLFVQAMLS